MIDINTIISQALAAAVAQALQPIQQEYDNKMGEMAQKIAALEGALTDRVLALESPSTQGIGVLLENLDNQEWFWHKIRAFTDGAVEQAVEQHCEEYDHDDFVTEDKLGEYVKTEDLASEMRDDVRDILNGVTVSIHI